MEEYETEETVEDEVDSVDEDAGDSFEEEEEVVEADADEGKVDWWGKPQTNFW